MAKTCHSRKLFPGDRHVGFLKVSWTFWLYIANVSDILLNVVNRIRFGIATFKLL